MKPLFILLFVFGLSLLFFKYTTKDFNYNLSARIAMCAMLIFTAIGHFVFTDGMKMMIPDFIPFKTMCVFLTGFLEIILGFGLLIPNLKTYTAWFLILFLMLLLPANIYASIKNINYQTGKFDGNGITYLWFRIPLQFLFMAWIFFSSIKHT